VVLVILAVGSSVRGGELAPRGPLVPMDPGAVVCTHPEVVISGEVVLEPGCIYEHRFVIEESNTTLDCNGAQIRPANPDHPAVVVKGQIDNVTVENCHCIGGRGINVRGPPREEGESHQELRDRSPTNVVVRNVYSAESRNCGVYFHHHTVGAVLQDSIVEDNFRVGIYFGAESQGHTIRNCLVRGNGYTFEDGTVETGWHRREGLAVDASSMNVIEDNHFDDNAFGGVFLYKNCWEHAAYKPDSWQRIQHSSDNQIRRNTFSNMDIGVWVASRQSRDLMFMYCGDPTPYDNPVTVADVFDDDYPMFESTIPAPYSTVAGIWPDFADHNTITDNTFEDIRLAGIRIEDDHNQVIGNLFIGDFDFLFLGAPFRANLLGEPVRGTTIRDNCYLGPEDGSFADLAALVPGEHTDTVIESNHRACVAPDGEVLRHGQGYRHGICRDGRIDWFGGCASAGAGGSLLFVLLVLAARRRRAAVSPG